MVSLFEFNDSLWRFKIYGAIESLLVEDYRRRKALLSLFYASLSDKFIIIDLYDNQLV